MAVGVCFEYQAGLLYEMTENKEERELTLVLCCQATLNQF